MNQRINTLDAEQSAPFLSAFYFLGIYLVLEKGVGFGSGWIAKAISFFPDLVICGILISFLLVVFLSEKSLRWSNIYLFIIPFLVVCAVSLSQLKPDYFIEGVLNTRSLIRYFIVLFVVLHLKIEDKHLRKFIFLIIALGVLEGVIASAQSFSDAPLLKYILPEDMFYEQFAGQVKTLKVGASVGTLAGPTALASFLLIPLTTVMAYGLQSRLTWYSATIYGGSFFMIFLGMVVSLKRAPVIMAVMALLLCLFLLKRYKVLVTSTVAVSLVLLLMFYLVFVNDGHGWDSSMAREKKIPYLHYFQNVMSPDYWRNSAENSRMFFIEHVGREAVLYNSIWGYGPVEPYTKTLMVQQNPELYYLFGYDAFKDVYWIAMLCFYGPLGLLTFVATLLYAIFASYRSLFRAYSQSCKTIFLTVIVVCALSLLYGFVARVFELRAFSFFLWLLIGLALNALLNNRQVLYELDS